MRSLSATIANVAAFARSPPTPIPMTLQCQALPRASPPALEQSINTFTTNVNTKDPE